MNAVDTSPNDAFLGTVVDGRYRIVSRLGEGGMGAVYEAEQIALSRRVALKVIHSSFAGNGEVQARFAREAMASGQLDGHPHVATAVDFGTLPDGSLYLVMQLVRGPSLRAILDAGRLPWERAVSLSAQVADALSAAHAAGIIHRDLKPDNVALVKREDGREVAKVLDFGIARVTSEAGEGAANEPKLTRIGTVIGTPGYMAPEQAVGDSVDARADLYSLGVMIHEMVTGALPFDGPDVTSILAQQFQHTPPKLSDATGDPSVPPELDELVLTLLARTAADRPATAGDVHRALSKLVRLSELPDDATGPTSLGRRTDATGGTPIPTTDVAPPLVRAATTMHTVATNASVRSRASFDALARWVESRLPPAYRAHAKLFAGFGVGLPALLLVVFVAARVLRSDETEASVPTGAPSTSALESAASAVRDLVARTPEPTPEVVAAIQTLSTSDNRAARTAAAQVIRAGGAGTPAYASKLVALEEARGCAARKAALAEVVALHDANVRPYLERLSRSPRRGCGFLGSRDCDACLRDDLRTALTALGTP